MSLTSELTKSNRGLYHLVINPAYGEDRQMSYEDWLKAADILEEELKLVGQKRVIVLHEKRGRLHAHVVWERYSHEKGIMISDSYSRLAQDRARKTIEQVLEQQRTPDRNKNRPEIKKTLTELWAKAKNGADFIKLAALNGYIIAKGRERRSFMVVDDTGRSFDLVRQLQGVRTKEVRELLNDQKLPTDKTAIQSIRSRDSFNQKQDAAISGINTYKDFQADKKGKQHALNEKMLAMKSMSSEITADAGDKNLSRSQNLATQMQRFYKNKIKDNSSAEEIKNKFKEQFKKPTQEKKQNVLDQNSP